MAASQLNCHGTLQEFEANHHSPSATKFRERTFHAEQRAVGHPHALSGFQVRPRLHGTAGCHHTADSLYIFIWDGNAGRSEGYNPPDPSRL